ncbi:MAG TPA: lipoyl(octanoyl) transferase LipB [Candidatus Xenobia bacterium]
MNALLRRETLVEWKGLLPYAEAWRLQQEVAEGVKRGTGGERLLLLQHPPVVTMARGADRSHVLLSSEELASRGAELVECNRGGDVTYHGPGQLVGYPIIDLKPDRCDVGQYLRDLEQLLIETLSVFGLTASRKPGLTGVWVGHEKIAALGVHMSRWVTTHGFALNVSPALEHFAWIVPCGIRDYGVTSMEKLLGSRTPPVEDVARAVCEVFPTIFQRTLIGRPRSSAGASEG